MAASDSRGFRPIPNPYIVGNPIEDRRMFFGREDDFAYISKKVTGGKKGGLIVLCGTRRSGKTSILFQIKGGRLGKEFVPVLIDMQSMTVNDDAEFLARLAQEIVAALGDPELDFERDYRRQSGPNPFSVFQGLIRKITVALAGRKLVLLFDEYELFEAHIGKGRFSTDILNLLATWMESQQGVFIVFTGSDKLEERNPRYWQAFLGKAIHRRISFLSKDDTLRLIQEPVRGVVAYDPDIPHKIYELTAGQPFYTQVICQSLVDHLNEEAKLRVAAADLRQTVVEIIENPLPQMVFSWSSLADVEKVALSVIAELSKEGPTPVQPAAIVAYPKQVNLDYRLDAGKLNEGLERLFHQDLLAKEFKGDGYTFKMDLWRQWMARMHSIWQVADEIAGSGKELGPGLNLKTSRRRRTRWLAASGVVVALAGAAFVYLAAVRSAPPARSPNRGTAIPDSATLSVATEPSGAEVFLDDRRLGVSPVTRRRLPAQAGVLKINLAGYAALSESLVLARDDTVEREYRLAELLGAVHVVTEPPGARVLLDGKDTGLRSPCTLADLSGRRRHRIRLELANHDPRTFADVAIIADSTLEVSHRFALKTYPLTVVSNPPGAELRVDGRYVGETNQNLAAVAFGTHSIELRKEGFEVESREIALPVAHNLLTIDLRRLPKGKLVFRLNPYGAIYINGELRTEIAGIDSFEVEPGVYECRLTNPHFAPATYTVEVEPGRRHVVAHDFMRSEDTR
jgi:hypothetical protein